MTLLLLAAPAHAFWGLLLAPIGGQAPRSERALAVVALQEGRATVTWSADQDGTEGSIGLLLPTPVPADVAVRSALDLVLRFDSATAPWQEALHCPDLMARNDVDTVPGCRTTPWTATPWPDARVDGLRLADAVALQGSVTLDVLSDAVPDTWLLENGLELPPGGNDVVAGWQAAGLSLVAVRFELVSAEPGGFLPPVQVAFDNPAEFAPDLTSAGLALGPADLQVWFLTEPDGGEVVDAVYGSAVLPRDCMLKGAYPASWDERADEALRGPDEPTWTTEWTGPVSTCTPCAGGPLDDLDLSAMGFAGTTSDAFLTRLRLRWDPSEWAGSPIYVPTGRVAALETHTFATDPDLAWLVPDCDEGFDPDATCPNLDPGGGCAVAPGAGLGLAIAAMAVLRRRRSVACALLVAGSAHAAPAARWEIAALWAPLSTERISAERDDYAHGLGPMAGGADIRWAFAGDERRSLGLSLGATVWRGDGVSGQAVVPRFTGADPFLGLSFRQGGWREGPLRPTAVVGIGLAAPALMPSIGAGESVLTSDLSLGAGAVIGRGTRRLLVELRSDLLPRTDGSHVDFDDRTGLPGWIWHYGRLSGTLRVGLALGPSQATPSSRPASSSAR